ncbi:MAG: RNA polymerase sigma-70 factor [Bacteroidales bacterium]|nr:RNA polymerase sigma-70 factor [Bacteroidales bacterium]MBN2761709.1 RNA polymerase sigma-70 factor [Bacteroidales bacterium]
MRTEKEILDLLNRGDEEAIRFIFDAYYEKLCLYAEAIIKDHQAAEDIVEDLFVSVWINAKTNPVHTAIKNYLYKSTYHNCLKHINKRRTEDRNTEKLHYTLKDIEIMHHETSGYPLSGLLVSEIEKKAEDILESLPEQCKKIYKLNRLEGLNYPEIAARLKITVGTVKTQMSRAFQKFREGLKEFMP